MSTVLVTGGNRGIGLEIVKQLAQTNQFKTIYLGARDVTKGTKALSSIPSSSTKIQVIPLDVTSNQSIQETVQFFSNEKLNVLIHNAGILIDGKTGKGSLYEAQQTLAVNYFGVINLNTALFDKMDEKTGRIIVVSSRMGQLKSKGKGLQIGNLEHFTTTEQVSALANEYIDAVKTNTVKQQGWDMYSYSPSYSISKCLVNAYVRVFDTLLKQRGSSITINSMCPNWVKTEIGGNSAPHEASFGAQTAVYLATSKDVENRSGGFYGEMRQLPF